MNERLKELRERSQKRKELLALALGASGPEELKNILHSDVSPPKKPHDNTRGGSPSIKNPVHKSVLEKSAMDMQALGNKSSDDIDEFEQEEIYTDSSTFLKGTQSANPHNDYCQHFVDTGERPQNFIRDVWLTALRNTPN